MRCAARADVFGPLRRAESGGFVERSIPFGIVLHGQTIVNMRDTLRQLARDIGLDDAWTATPKTEEPRDIRGLYTFTRRSSLPA